VRKEKGTKFKACSKKNGKCSKEQETIKVVADDGAAVQNTCLNHTSLPEEGISESYTVVNSFSELLTVIFQSNIFFSQSYMDHYVELLFF